MYKPQNKDIWTGRIDWDEGELGVRWHQQIEMLDLSKANLPTLTSNQKGIVIIGFKSDEGVRRNKGRVGAQEGPEALRIACSNHASHFHAKTKLFDAGNVICKNNELEIAQSELRHYISIIKSAGYFPFVFGGGHEVAYPHFMGLSDALNDKLIGIINIDAHFDLRIPEVNGSSGTPFFQISQECQKMQKAFNYFCIGIQQSSNTEALFNRAQELGVDYTSSNDTDQADSKILDFIQRVDYIYLTICLDVFDVAFAPGVSAPSAMGLHPQEVVKIIKQISKSGKLISADIAELNPLLDQNNMTAKLAAKLAFELITDI